MRKCLTLLLSLASSILAPSVFGNCIKTHQPVFLDIYYAPTQNLSGRELKSALNQIIRGHQRFSYSCVWDILKEADEAVGDSGRSITAFYTRRNIAKDNRDQGQNDSNSWNREHIWAKSHGFKRKSQHAYTDVHHIRPADRSVNGDRDDHDFDEGGRPNRECTECLEGNGTWEAPDVVKGDVARMMFYMDTRYEGNDSSGTPDLVLVNRVNTPRSQSVGEFGKLCTLYKWHEEDPVSDEEIRRNNVIYRYQGNRNPFIDRPEYVAQIWAAQCGRSAPPVSDPDPDPDPDPRLAREQLSEQIKILESTLNQLKDLIEDL